MAREDGRERGEESGRLMRAVAIAEKQHLERARRRRAGGRLQPVGRVGV